MNITQRIRQWINKRELKQGSYLIVNRVTYTGNVDKPTVGPGHILYILQSENVPGAVENDSISVRVCTEVRKTLFSRWVASDFKDITLHRLTIAAGLNEECWSQGFLRKLRFMKQNDDLKLEMVRSMVKPGIK